MTEETQVGGPNDGQQEPTTNDAATTAAAQKEARRSLLEKFGLETEKAAIQQQPQTTTEPEVDLTGVDPEIATKIRAKLAAADKKNEYVGTLATYGLEQARTAEALKIARELKLEDDEIAGIEKALSGAKTPDAVNLAGRELRIKLREDGSVQIQAPAKNKATTTEGADAPPVDTGRGGGQNRSTTLQAKIDAIDLNDPEAEKKLEALRPEMEAAQARFQERAVRGR